MFDVVLDALFPRRCAACGVGSWPFCPGCRSGLITLTGPSCERCGRPAGRPVTRCRDCPPPPIAMSRAAFAYEGSARAAVHRLKFSGWRTVARALGEAMVAVNAFPADEVAWVPLSRARLADRGYDQARALASVVAAGLGLPASLLLQRVASTTPQARRGGAERRAAMRGAFRIAAGRSPPARVLLVDDVLTTGATAAACAAALIDGGARSVGLLTAARALSGSEGARVYTSGGLPAGSVVARGGVPR